MEQMGESTYRNHATFFQLFHTLSDIEKEGSVHNHIIVDSRNVKLTSPVSANKYETEIENYWINTKNAFLVTVSKAEKEWREYVNKTRSATGGDSHI